MNKLNNFILLESESQEDKNKNENEKVERRKNENKNENENYKNENVKNKKNSTNTKKDENKNMSLEYIEDVADKLFKKYSLGKDFNSFINVSDRATKKIKKSSSRIKRHE